jgi:hypothetical protein
MWRIEIRHQSQDDAVRQRVSADVAAWQQLSNVSLSVVEERVGTGRLRGEAGSSASATAVKSKLASGARRRAPPPRQVPVDELPTAVPFQVFVVAGFDPPHWAWNRETEDDPPTPVVTMAYSVVEDGWHVGNVWLTLCARPFADSPWESWHHEGGYDISEEHAETHYRYKGPGVWTIEARWRITTVSGSGPATDWQRTDPASSGRSHALLATAKMGG